MISLKVLRILGNFLIKCRDLTKNFLRLIQIAPKIVKDGGYLAYTPVYENIEELLKGKNILITGGSSGIGKAIAQELLASGGNIVVTGRKIQKLIELKKEITNANFKILEWDHSDFSILEKKLEEVELLFKGEVDILINNAGIITKNLFPKVTEDDWDKIYSTNSKAPFFLSQEISKRWINKSFIGYKKIINISSQGGFVGATYPYRMTKWDLRGLTEGLGKNLISKNIIVNGIAPGIVMTKMQHKLYSQGENYFCDLNPSKRICHPEEIAKLASYLCKDESNFIIGQTILIDGGFSLK